MLRGRQVIKLTGWGGWMVHEIYKGRGGSCRGGVGHVVKQPEKC